MKYSVLLLTLCFISVCSYAQVSRQKYFPPKDTLVIHKLQHWSNDKFGLLMHWGTYSQWGIVESWSLCPEDEDWCQRRGPYAANYFEYKNSMKTCKPLLTLHTLTPINGLPRRPKPVCAM
jgi:alpha-L-fucosidase